MADIRRGVEEGMAVYSADGVRVGRVVRCGADRFEIEKGFFFPKDYLIPYSEVSTVEEREVFVRLSKSQLEENWHRAEVLGDASETLPEGADGYTAGPMPPPGQGSPLTNERNERYEHGYRRNVATEPGYSGPGERLNVGAVDDDQEDLATPQRHYDDEEEGRDGPMLFEGRHEIDDYLF